MNERIKELINEATSFKGGLIEGKYDIEVFDKQKFAELIIQECAEFVSNDRQNDDYGVFVSNRIKQHFGVGEQVTEPAELHTCPYAEEIHGDYETLCDCDEEQQYQCRMDI